MKVLINDEKCTGCGQCARVCPQIILEILDKKMRVTDEERCMGCFGCDDECPSGAVRLLRAPRDVKEIPIEPPPDSRSKCDVAIVGAGPAGLGAAIVCARAGLSTIVFERLPGLRRNCLIYSEPRLHN